MGHKEKGITLIVENRLKKEDKNQLTRPKS